jgi:hypothetical protein
MGSMESPRSNLLPVIEHVLAVYKIWHIYKDNFPQKSKYTLGDTIDARFILVLELLFTATYQDREQKMPTLGRVQTGIDMISFLLRIAWEVKALDTKKYAELGEKLTEVGKMVGGWKRGLTSKTPTP